jgi:hypothetical protein
MRRFAGVNCCGLGRKMRRRATCPLLLTLLLWSSASSWWIYPHSLSYFNEAIGGPLNGPTHLLGSNVDWGQDLRYLIWSLYSPDYDTSVDERKLAFHGIYDPGSLGFPAGDSVSVEDVEFLAIAKKWDGRGVKPVLPKTAIYWISVNFEHGMRDHFRHAGRTTQHLQTSPPVEHQIGRPLEFAHPVTYTMTKTIID